MTSFTNVLIALEGKTIPSLKEKNQRAAEKWRQMPQDEKQQYVEAAKQKTVQNGDIPADSWGEATRILHNMQKNVRLTSSQICTYILMFIVKCVYIRYTIRMYYTLRMCYTYYQKVTVWGVKIAKYFIYCLTCICTCIIDNLITKFISPLPLIRICSFIIRIHIF